LSEFDEGIEQILLLGREAEIGQSNMILLARTTVGVSEYGGYGKQHFLVRRRLEAGVSYEFLEVEHHLGRKRLVLSVHLVAGHETFSKCW
jgi:hypothetical protein